MDLDTLTELPFWEWPSDGARIVRDGLKNPDSAVRLRAVRLAHLIVDDLLAQDLLTMLELDEDDEVAGAAALALGPALGDMESMSHRGGVAALSRERATEIKRAFKRFYHDASIPDLVRRRLLEASIHAPAAWHRGAVRAAWLSPSESWRTTALFCMGFIAGFDEEIVSTLESDVVDHQIAAIRSAGAREIEEAGPALARVLRNRLLSDSEPDSQALVASAAAPVLLSHAAPNPSTKRAVLFAALTALPRVDAKLALDIIRPLRAHRDEELAEVANEAYREAVMWYSLGEERLDADSLDADFAGIDGFDDL